MALVDVVAFIMEPSTPKNAKNSPKTTAVVQAPWNATTAITITLMDLVIVMEPIKSIAEFDWLPR